MNPEPANDNLPYCNLPYKHPVRIAEVEQKNAIQDDPEQLAAMRAAFLRKWGV